MRWTVKRKQRPAIGDIRHCRGFLLIPAHIGGEWRWLCDVAWEERYGWHGIWDEWIPTRWLEWDEARNPVQR